MFNDILDSIINNATIEEIEIIREKLNNHLINHIYESDEHEKQIVVVSQRRKNYFSRIM